MSVTHLPALLFAFILTGLGALHIYWGFGGRWGIDGVIPTQGDDGQGTFEPPPVATFVVAGLLFTAAALGLLGEGLLPSFGQDTLVTIGVWGVAVVFFARSVGDFRYVGFFKRIRHTRFARRDTRIYSPLCLLLASMAVFIAL